MDIYQIILIIMGSFMLINIAVFAIIKRKIISTVIYFIFYSFILSIVFFMYTTESIEAKNDGFIIFFTIFTPIVMLAFQTIINSVGIMMEYCPEYPNIIPRYNEVKQIDSIRNKIKLLGISSVISLSIALLIPIVLLFWCWKVALIILILLAICYLDLVLGDGMYRIFDFYELLGVQKSIILHPENTKLQELYNNKVSFSQSLNQMTQLLKLEAQANTYAAIGDVEGLKQVNKELDKFNEQIGTEDWNPFPRLSTNIVHIARCFLISLDFFIKKYMIYTQSV